MHGNTTESLARAGEDVDGGFSPDDKGTNDGATAAATAPEEEEEEEEDEPPELELRFHAQS